ncbi:MAG: alpha/beta hydrolase [Dehalococcoidia bacterium]|jgi:pimeloyl-ACP methyl ester carboxylesterase|nr:alpha/beta hydrolase [Dehalococcoidia bacterium]
MGARAAALTRPARFTRFTGPRTTVEPLLTAPLDPTECTYAVNGMQLRVFEWPVTDPTGPTLFFAHATSFHARCWDAVIERLPGRRIIALDFRGHGGSSKPEPPYDWHACGEDVAELSRQLNLRDAVAIGHSMGGHSVTLAAAMEPERFAGLLLVDPVIQPPDHYGDGAGSSAARRGAGAETGGRRNAWASADEMYESYHGRGPFTTWDDRVLRDYCEHGVMPAPAGHGNSDGFVLACPPHIEASIYAGSTGTNIYEEISSIDVPVRVIRAREPDGDDSPFSTSPTAPDLASRFRRGEDVHLPDATHFIPMESPALIAQHVEEMAALL